MVVIAATTILWTFLSSQLEIRIISQDSMEPALRQGEKVLFLKNPTNIQRYDILLFHDLWRPKIVYIKRCIGLPGEIVKIERKEVYVDGKKLEEDPGNFIDARIFDDSEGWPATFRRRDNFGPSEVPAQHYFCLGDNRDHSTDSRMLGYIDNERVFGKAILIIQPLNRISTL